MNTDVDEVQKFAKNELLYIYYPSLLFSEPT